jgi:hypothetical protein
VSEIEFAERSKRGDDRYFLMFVAMTFNPLLLILELVGCARAVFAVPLGPRPLSLSFCLGSRSATTCSECAQRSNRSAPAAVRLNGGSGTGRTEAATTTAWRWQVN